MAEEKTIDVIPNRDDDRPDIQQAVEARSDAVDRGEEPDRFTRTGEPDGVGGTGGEVKNQDIAEQ